MTRLSATIALVALYLTATACLGQGVRVDAARMVSAIYGAEGGARATYAYGIRSVKYSSVEDARRICLRSVQNNLARWHKAGEPGDFVSYMATRYCPLEPDKTRWVKNVNYFYRKP